MNMQEMFDKALAGLREQGEPSGYSTPDTRFTCKYRDSKGNKCAVGMLIPDSEYSEDMEGVLASSRIILRATGATEFQALMLASMQDYLHDTPARNSDSKEAFLSAMEKGAEDFASRYNLEYSK